MRKYPTRKYHIDVDAAFMALDVGAVSAMTQDIVKQVFSSESAAEQSTAVAEKRQGSKLPKA